MKKTDEDREFAKRFAEALQEHVIRAQDSGTPLSAIAKKLGVTAPGLKKQLAGGTPSIRTIALAYATYGVSVPYEGVPVARVVAPRKKSRKQRLDERQLTLPLEITAPVLSKELSLKRLPRGTRRYRLQLVIGI